MDRADCGSHRAIEAIDETMVSPKLLFRIGVLLVLQSMSRHSAVWDSRAKRMIVFGGVDASGIKLDDVQMSLGFP